MRLGSIDKCLSVIELLSQYPDGLRLTEISASLGLPDSSIHHILSTLRERDYVRQNAATKRYQLGFRFLEISGRIVGHLDVQDVARGLPVETR